MARIDFTKLLLKASQPLKTSPLETKLRDGYSEKKIRRGKSVNALEKLRGKSRERSV